MEKQQDFVCRLFRERKTDKGLLMAWPTKRVQVHLNSIDRYFAPEESRPENATTKTSAPPPAKEDTLAVLLEPQEDNDNDDEGYDEARTRSFNNHLDVYDLLPCTKESCKLKTHIRRLLIQGMIDFNSNDFGDMIAFLGKSASLTTMDQFLDHLF